MLYNHLLFVSLSILKDQTNLRKRQPRQMANYYNGKFKSK